MSISGVPRSISTTPGCSTAPEMVTRDVPGSSTSPWARNASGPVRAIMATCASVSALCTRAPRAPDAEGGALVRAEGREGLARFDPARQRRLLAGDEAVGRPHHDLGNGRAAGGDPLGHRAPSTAAATWWRPSGTQTTTRRAPVAAASSWAPSSTRCGDRMSRSLSLSLAGSPSMALTRMVPPAAGGVRHGELDGGREPGPAPAGQAGGLERRRRRPRASRGLAADGQRDRAQRRPRDRPGRSDGPAAGSGPVVGSGLARR